MIEPPACVRQGWVMCMLHIFKNIPHNPIGYDIKIGTDGVEYRGSHCELEGWCRF